MQNKNKKNIHKKNLLAEYKIITPLGRGSTSFVYKVKNIKTNKIYAMKEIENNKNNFSSNEIKIQKNLNHPNIVKLKNYSTKDNKNIYLLMEFCEKGELFGYIKENSKLDENLIKNYSFQLLEGLNYIHSKKIIHRDIKLGNIFIKKNKLKIGDFGLSIKKDDKTLIKNKCGTPNYISPEIILDSKFSKKSDIWALGCVIFALATGNLPFDSEKVEDIYSNILEYKIDFDKLSGYSENFINFLKLMLNKNYKKRASAKELLENIFYKNKELTISTMDLNEEYYNKKINDKLIKSVKNKNNIFKFNHLRLSKSPTQKKKFKNFSIFKTIENKTYKTNLGELHLKNDEIELHLIEKKKIISINKLKNDIKIRDINNNRLKKFSINEMPKKINVYYKYILDVLELIENKNKNNIIKNKYGSFEINKNKILPYFKSKIKNFYCIIYLKNLKIKIKEKNLNNFIELDYNNKNEFIKLPKNYQNIIKIQNFNEINK